MANEIKKSTQEQPLDWIKCPEGRTKAVVACMANCTRKCDQFWRFFERIGKTPVQYYNVNNIGEQVMRRIVFDCDRCGKKDIDDVFSRYDEKAYPEDKLLDQTEMVRMFEKTDYLFDEIGASFSDIIGILERERQWRHFCDKCFNRILGSWATILDVKKTGGGAINDAPVEIKEETNKEPLPRTAKTRKTKSAA